MNSSPHPTRSLTGSALFAWVASMGLALGACGKTTSCPTDAATDHCGESSGGGSPSSGGAPAAGGSAGSGGTPGTGGSGEGGEGALPNDCAYQDAIPSGDDCATIVGYAWHPPGCLPIQCGCVGGDCDQLYPSFDACVSAHEDCPGTN